jgi:hypothetical protein
MGWSWQVGREPSARKRAMEAEDKVLKTKRDRQESGDEGSTTASTMGGENESSSSSMGHQSDNETPAKGPFCDDEASAAACSLATIMMSIQNGQAGKRPNKSQPLSAPGGIESAAPKSSTSSVSGDDDEASGDVTQVKKQRRREKNRASAQQSRQRKKYHLETLEVRVDELERERAALMSRVEALAAENRRLRALAPGGAAETDAAVSASKADEIAGAGLLNQLAQAAQKLSALS